MPLSFALSIKLYATAAQRPPSSLPTNKKFFLLCVARHNRKNFLFVGSEEGGQRAAVAYSLIESAKLNGIDPYLYIKDVLTQVWTHPQSRIRELMPRLWKPASQDSVPDRHPPPAADTS